MADEKWIDGMHGASVTNQSFNPRYLIELTTAGTLSVLPTASRSDGSGTSFGGTVSRTRTSRISGNGPVYVYRCTVCGKIFHRKSMDGSLNLHKTPKGYDCFGTYGAYVRTKY